MPDAVLRYRPGLVGRVIALTLAIGMAGFGFYVMIVGIARMSDGGLWGSGTAFAFLLFAFLLWRASRLQVILSDETLEIRNFFSTYRPSRLEVRRVEISANAAVCAPRRSRGTESACRCTRSTRAISSMLWVAPPERIVSLDC